MEYVYPAIFSKNDDSTYTITFPDLAGCVSEGKSLANALYMAEKALVQWLSYLQDEKEDIPVASDIHDISADDSAFVSLVKANVRSNKAVRRTISLPEWMDDAASRAGITLSKITQDALSERLNMQ